MLSVRGLGVTIGKTRILSDLSFSLREHGLLMAIGPNGSGKTTMVRAIAGAIAHEGEALLDGRPIGAMPPDERARMIGVLTQQNVAQFAYSARELVAVGRYAHKKGVFSGLGEQDRSAIDEAMALTQVDHLADQLITTLSGGELQRVCLARAFAQDPRLLLLDEPTNHLDIQHQIALFDIISRWAQRPGKAVLAIVHDLNIANSYGTEAMLLHEGRAVAQGDTRQVLSRQNLHRVYNVDLVAWMQSLLARWSD